MTEQDEPLNHSNSWTTVFVKLEDIKLIGEELVDSHGSEIKLLKTERKGINFLNTLPQLPSDYPPKNVLPGRGDSRHLLVPVGTL